MKKKNVITKNYLEKIPTRSPEIKWSKDEKGIVTLEIENKGWANRIAQVVFRRLGSFVWPLIDGKSNIIQIGEAVDKEFGENAKPLYERLARYFQILESYHFIDWTDA